MTLVSFFQTIKSGLEWVANSELAFIIISACFLIFVCCPVLASFWRFIRDEYIFSRCKRGD